MQKLLSEAPLDDFIHDRVPLWLASGAVRKHGDLLVSSLPFLVLYSAYHFCGDSASVVPSVCEASFPYWFLSLSQERGSPRIPELVLEFGLMSVYKFICCVATRFPPAAHDNTRTCCNGWIAMSTWVDYGLSGHTAGTVLLWLHLATPLALCFALFQSMWMVVTRDHYSLDVLHAWVFCFAVKGVFAGLLVDEASA